MLFALTHNIAVAVERISTCGLALGKLLNRVQAVTLCITGSAQVLLILQYPSHG
jgi:hypothetical protein